MTASECNNNISDGNKDSVIHVIGMPYIVNSFLIASNTICWHCSGSIVTCATPIEEISDGG